MKISFTGLCNMSVIECNQPKEGVNGFWRMVLQLNNNKTGNDLKEFKEILKEFPDKTNHGVLKIDVMSFSNEVEGSNGERYIINLNKKELKMCDKNIPIFEKIAKKLNEIANNPNNKFIVTENYKNSSAYLKNLYENMNIASLFRDSVSFSFAHNPENIKNKALKIVSIFDKIIFEYLK